MPTRARRPAASHSSACANWSSPSLTPTSRRAARVPAGQAHRHVEVVGARPGSAPSKIGHHEARVDRVEHVGRALRRASAATAPASEASTCAAAVNAAVVDRREDARGGPGHVEVRQHAALEEVAPGGDPRHGVPTPPDPDHQDPHAIPHLRREFDDFARQATSHGRYRNLRAAEATEIAVGALIMLCTVGAAADPRCSDHKIVPAGAPDIRAGCSTRPGRCCGWAGAPLVRAGAPLARPPGAPDVRRCSANPSSRAPDDRSPRASPDISSTGPGRSGQGSAGIRQDGRWAAGRPPRRRRCPAGRPCVATRCPRSRAAR